MAEIQEKDYCFIYSEIHVFKSVNQWRAKRMYIQHPIEIPIRYRAAGSAQGRQGFDSRQGGLSFQCDDWMSPGSAIELRIELDPFPLEFCGTVVWCKGRDKGYQVDVCFMDPDTRFAVRMAEQLCHIECYRREVHRQERRSLSAEQAAREWIERHAAGFPGIEHLR